MTDVQAVTPDPPCTCIGMSATTTEEECARCWDPDIEEELDEYGAKR